MPNKQNIDKVEDLKQKIENSKSMVFAQYHGLSSNGINELRKVIRESGAKLEVTKNTLLKVALKEKNIKDTEALDNLKGPIATIFSYEDAITPIKALTDFIRNFELPLIKAGIIDGKYASAEKIDLLSKLPSREELLAKVVGSLKSPLSGLINTFAGTQRKVVYVFSAIAQKKTKDTN